RQYGKSASDDSRDGKVCAAERRDRQIRLAALEPRQCLFSASVDNVTRHPPIDVKSVGYCASDQPDSWSDLNEHNGPGRLLDRVIASDCVDPVPGHSKSWRV